MQRSVTQQCSKYWSIFDSQENKSHKQEYLFLASFDDVLVLITLIISLKTANADMPRIGIVGEQVI
jgi:cephalosporin-C deacetylase-like acetyl esterase